MSVDVKDSDLTELTSDRGFLCDYKLDVLFFPPAAKYILEAAADGTTLVFFFVSSPLDLGRRCANLRGSL